VSLPLGVIIDPDASVVVAATGGGELGQELLVGPGGSASSARRRVPMSIAIRSTQDVDGFLIGAAGLAVEQGPVSATASRSPSSSVTWW